MDWSIKIALSSELQDMKRAFNWLVNSRKKDNLEIWIGDIKGRKKSLTTCCLNVFLTIKLPTQNVWIILGPLWFCKRISFICEAFIVLHFQTSYTKNVINFIFIFGISPIWHFSFRTWHKWMETILQFWSFNFH